MVLIRGRFAPSPSGEMHLGNVWAALLAWLQIRSLGGIMVLRIEDLDPDRSRLGYIEQLIKDLQWLGLDYDEGPDKGGTYGPYCQSQRRHLFQQALDSLQTQGRVYPCYCTRAEIHATVAPHAGERESVYPGWCRELTMSQRKARQGRKPALRLRVDEGTTVSFCDGIQGFVVQDISTTCGDFIVRRSDGIHAYQLAVVVDDAAMRISHVLRGDDLLDSTPRQILLYRLLGLTPPQYTHVPLLYGQDGHRLSKRQKDLSIAALRNRGVRSTEIIGYLAWKASLLEGWEAVEPYQLIPLFSPKRLSCQPVIVGDEFRY